MSKPTKLEGWTPLVIERHYNDEWCQWCGARQVAGDNALFSEEHDAIVCGRGCAIEYAARNSGEARGLDRCGVCGSSDVAGHPVQVCAECEARKLPGCRWVRASRAARGAMQDPVHNVEKGGW